MLCSEERFVFLEDVKMQMPNEKPLNYMSFDTMEGELEIKIWVEIKVRVLKEAN